MNLHLLHFEPFLLSSDPIYFLSIFFFFFLSLQIYKKRRDFHLVSSFFFFSFFLFFLFFLLKTIVNVRFFLSRYTSKKTTIFPDPPSKIIFPLRGNNYRHHNQHFDFDFRFLIQVLRRNQVVPKSDDLMFSIRSKKIEDWSGVTRNINDPFIPIVQARPKL